MLKISRYRVDKYLLIPMILFAIISIITIYSAQTLLPNTMQDLALKQFLWYLVGFAIAYGILVIGNDFMQKNSWILYGLGNLSLVGLFFFGKEINEAKCWYSIPGIGTIQPSEFMKIILILLIAKLIQEFHKKYTSPTVFEEFIFLLKIALIVAIPSILTFLQPDTGVVLIYLLITICMLFISGIRYRWFIILFTILGLAIGSVLIIYFCSQELFIRIFGTSFFLRVDRLLDWSSGSGFQLQYGMTAIGSGGLLGHGFHHTPIYFPEPQTDFIFAVFASNFGFIGSFLLLALIIFFDIRLIITAMKANNKIDKYIIGGIVGMLIYQQFQNIGMTYGIMPITGITLPYISYGGSSLLSYMIMTGIIFHISNENIRYTNK